jgi:hypothetical protein
MLQAGLTKLGSKVAVADEGEEGVEECPANALASDDRGKLQVPDQIPSPQSSGFQAKPVEPLAIELLNPQWSPANDAGDHFK